MKTASDAEKRGVIKLARPKRVPEDLKEARKTKGVGPPNKQT